MSDEGLLNVEDDDPQPAVEPAPAVEAVAEVPPEPAEEEAAAEVEAVEVAGKKYVPVGAVIAERKQRQALQAKADKADQLEAYVNDSRPYVEFLKNNPDLLKPRQAPPAPTTFGQPADPAAEALAKTLDLYTPEGKPDIGRANQIRSMVTQTARAEAQQMIAPYQEDSAQTKSARNFQMALTIKDQQGRSPSPQSLAQIWKTMPAHQTADPNVASILALTALGLDSVSQKPAPVPPGQPPVTTEGQGNAGRRPSLSALETSIARDRGMSESKWAEQTKGFVSGRAQQLED